VDERLSEIANERSAGIWVALVIYALGGVYMLSFWMLFDRLAFHLALLGILSLAISAALFKLSRWGFWLGLFTFPLFLVDVACALLTSISFVGWYPNVQTLAFNASMVVYLIFLCLGFLLLIDRRSLLKTDRILDLIGGPSIAKGATSAPDKR
jgi:uncharacterized membrane protein (DUF2068 family)